MKINFMGNYGVRKPLYKNHGSKVPVNNKHFISRDTSSIVRVQKAYR